MTRVTLCTASTPGAVAVLQLHGEGAIDVLVNLTGRKDWPIRRALLCGFADIDEGLAVRINDTAAQLMPHGGPRVVQRLIEHLTAQLGCAYDAAPSPAQLYPEADSSIQADMLDVIARATSPAAIDLLAAQPAAWRALLKQSGVSADQRKTILDQSRTLDQLITPPTVVVVGPPNAGKSTLTNALLGKAVSLVADLPGTTRDWVGALVELSPSDAINQAVAVNWLDTPGLRTSDDAIEQRAITLARDQVERAGVLIALRGSDQGWPEPASLPRAPDLWAVNKADDADDDQPEQAGLSEASPLHISAKHQRGLRLLQRRVIQQLGLDTLDTPQPWAFNDRLRRWCEPGEACDLTEYLGGV